MRPLSDRGQHEAVLLVDVLAGYSMRRVESSPALRCRQTVVPLATFARLPIEVAEDLAEGFDGRSALDRLLARPEPVIAACSHGDVIGDVLEILVQRGVSVESRPTPPAATWILDVSHEAVTSAAFVGPPAR